jgi:chemotaxis protein CheD
MRELRVRIADFAAVKGDGLLVTRGLGSCVAIALHDREARVGGLAHVLLPEPMATRDHGYPAKFAGLAVPALVAEMRELGANEITARIAGGASMFASLLSTGGVNMGERNVRATRDALELAGVPLLSEDVGGDWGRSVYFHVAEGRVVVRSLAAGDVSL